MKKILTFSFLLITFLIQAQVRIVGKVIDQNNEPLIGAAVYLNNTTIGTTTDDQRLRLNMHGKCWCDIPVPPLVDEAPEYDRPYCEYPKPAALSDIDQSQDPLKALKTLMACPDLASKRWVWEQYDHLISGEIVQEPGKADAAIVKVNDTKALAISSDCTPRYCHANPFEGGKQAVAESYRNICASGAKPLAVTNNLNFGNPEKEQIMAQFVGCIEGTTQRLPAISRRKKLTLAVRRSLN